MQKNSVDISGKRFGRLVAIEVAGNFGKDKKQYWRCKCDCGNEKIVNKGSLMKGLTKSCGCLRSEVAREKAKSKTGHGIKRGNEHLYAIWQGMKARCSNSQRKEAKYYFFKGIRVCKEWENDFLLFKDWAIKNGYKVGLTLDRINSDKGYSPDNCRFVDRYVQNNNTSKNKFITLDGETLTIAQWTRKMDLPRGLISSRLKNGWSEERAVKTSVQSKRK